MKIDRTGKVAYWCKTKELAKEFLKECDEQGIVWGLFDTKTTRWTYWEYHRENTCYRIIDDKVYFNEKYFCVDECKAIVEYKGKDNGSVITAEVTTESKIETTTIAQIRELISDLSTLIATRKRIKSEIVRTGIDEEIKRVKAILTDNIMEV